MRKKLSCLRTYVGELVCGSRASDKDNVALVSNTIWQFTAVQGYVCFEKQGDEKEKKLDKRRGGVRIRPETRYFFAGHIFLLST